jgi:DNA-binding NtrC family response regulator
VIVSSERALARRKPRAEAAPAGTGAGDEPRSFEQSILEFALESRMTLREVGDLYIERILSMTHGNKVQAARTLGINRRTLYRRGGAPKEREG